MLRILGLSYQEVLPPPLLVEDAMYILFCYGGMTDNPFKKMLRILGLSYQEVLPPPLLVEDAMYILFCYGGMTDNPFKKMLRILGLSYLMFVESCYDFFDIGIFDTNIIYLDFSKCICKHV